MASTTVIGNLIVPKVFTPYVQLQTATKSKLIQSGAVARDSFLDNFLSQGGDIATVPFYKDLTRTASNVSTDVDGTSSTAQAITGSGVLAHRLSRNQSWTANDLAADLTGSDPLQNIGDRVARYWAWDLQNTFLSALDGVFRANRVNNSADMIYDISGATYTAGTNTISGNGAYSSGVTTIGADAIIDTLATMGDSMDELNTLLVHPVVYARLLKENKIDFIPNSEEKRSIPTYMGMEVVYDSAIPSAYNGISGRYVSYILGRGAIRLGMGLPKTPTEVWRDPAKGNGGGVETLFSRQEFVVAPEGNSFTANYVIGGAAAGSASTNLGHEGSWTRAYPERKQVRLAALITREA